MCSQPSWTCHTLWSVKGGSLLSEDLAETLNYCDQQHSGWFREVFIQCEVGLTAAPSNFLHFGRTTIGYRRNKGKMKERSPNIVYWHLTSSSCLKMWLFQKKKDSSKRSSCSTLHLCFKILSREMSFKAWNQRETTPCVTWTVRKVVTPRWTDLHYQSWRTDENLGRSWNTLEQHGV